MAILDNEMIMSNAQAVTTAEATPSANVIDFGVAGAGKDKKVIVSVNTTVAASAGAANVTFKVQCDDNADFTSATDLFATAAIAKATLVAGYRVLEFTLPATVERFVRVTYTPDTNNLTEGKFNAYVDTAIQTNMV